MYRVVLFRFLVSVFFYAFLCVFTACDNHEPFLPEDNIIEEDKGDDSGGQEENGEPGENDDPNSDDPNSDDPNSDDPNSDDPNENEGGNKEGENNGEDPANGEEDNNKNETVPLKDLRILAIGNSYAEDAVTENLAELFDACGANVHIGCAYVGSCSLEMHWDYVSQNKAVYAYKDVRTGHIDREANKTLQSIVKSEKWDVITFQQVSGLSGVYSSYDPYLTDLIAWVTEISDADLYFHQTWSYTAGSSHSDFARYEKSQLKMYEAIVEASVQALEDHPQIIGVIPVGTAIQNARTSYLGDTFNRDGKHLELTYGRYTAACTWFEKLSGRSVVGNPYAPSGVDEKMKNVAQTAAHNAVSNPFSVTPFSD